MSFIATFPEACPMRDARHRYCAVRRYPYGLIYRVDAERVRIVAVAHNRQMPGFWTDCD
jgi:plasmid stabilization system protein ParE